MNYEGFAKELGDCFIKLSEDTKNIPLFGSLETEEEATNYALDWWATNKEVAVFMLYQEGVMKKYEAEVNEFVNNPEARKQMQNLAVERVIKNALELWELDREALTS